MPAKCSLLESGACAALIGLDSIVRVSALPRPRIRRRLPQVDLQRRMVFRRDAEHLQNLPVRGPGGVIDPHPLRKRAPLQATVTGGSFRHRGNLLVAFGG
jgi:hypothetical protein